MKKYLPIMLFVLGLVVMLLAIYFLRGRNDLVGVEGDNAPELPFEKRPFVSLIPSEDGHWLTLKIDKLVNAVSMDYELIYVLPDGRNQGPSGTIKLENQDTIERKLLIGSESSGNYYYDEGVEKGTLALRFRDKKEKLLAKLSTEFHLQKETAELTSMDGEFKYAFDSKPEGGYYLTMQTFGLTDIPDMNIKSGPYAVFSSVIGEKPGKVTLNGENLYLYKNNDWLLLEDSKSVDIGIFISAR